MSTNDTDRDGQEGGKHRRRQTCSVCKGEGGHYISTNGNGPERKEWRPCGSCRGTGKI